MKHDIKISLYLLLLFLAAQIVGLFVLSSTMSVEETTTPDGASSIVVNYEEIMTGRPEVTGAGSFVYVLVSVLIGTLILLLLIKLKMRRFWKGWFFLAVGLTLSLVFNVYLPDIPSLLIGFGLAFLKIFKPNAIIHNATEILMYSGIAVLIVPIFSVGWMIALLLAISVYDFFAVFISKHMVQLAEFQSSAKVFAGLLIPYKRTSKDAEVKMEIPQGVRSKSSHVRSAILGGGDIAFPLLFSGVVMSDLLLAMPRTGAFLVASIISLTSGAALFVLLMMGRKDKFYPAMPFITAGCLLGYGAVLLLSNV